MFWCIIFTTWVVHVPLVNAIPCELYKTSVMFREHCKALCDYISPCESFTYSPATHLCSVWNSPGNGQQRREHTPEDPGHPCSTRPCDVTDICVPVMTGTQFKCLPYDSTCSCEQPDLEINNASLVSTPAAPIHSSVALYECNDGFQHVAGSNTITCHLQEWSRLSIVCREINCKEVSWLIPNATSTAALTSKYGATVTYSCPVGYINTGGNNTSYCQENGEWSKPTIECKVIQCPEDAPIIGYTTTNMISRNYGDIVTYSCVDGYKYLGGHTTSLCQESGTWSEASIVCGEINCKETSWLIPNATSSTAALTSKYGDTVTYSCAVGYVNIGGNDTSYCQENGEWSKPTIECKVIQCPEDVPIIGNTTTNMISRNYGDIFTYSCVDGYKYLEGQNTSLCQESGTWSGASIVCGEWQEWAWKVLGFSSQFRESSWHAVHILGKFDVYPQYGDIEGSWAPLDQSCENGNEWIQVEFAVMLYIRRVDIYETSSAGLVKTVSVSRNGTWDIIWTASSVTVIEHSRIFSPQFTPLTFPSNRAMIKTDCTSVVGNWVEFDAIKIYGLTSPPQ